MSKATDSQKSQPNATAIAEAAAPAAAQGNDPTAVQPPTSNEPPQPEEVVDASATVAGDLGILDLDVDPADLTRARLAESRVIGIPGGNLPVIVWNSSTRSRDKKAPQDMKASAVAVRYVLESAPPSVGLVDRSRQVRVEVLGYVIGPAVPKANEAVLSSELNSRLLAIRTQTARQEIHAERASPKEQIIATLSATLQVNRNNGGMQVTLNRSSNIDPEVVYQAPFYYDNDADYNNRTSSIRVNWDKFAPRAEALLTHVLRCAAFLELDGTINEELPADHPDHATLTKLIAAGQGEFFARLFAEMVKTQVENAERREKAQGASGTVNLANIGQQRTAGRGNTTVPADAETL